MRTDRPADSTELDDDEAEKAPKPPKPLQLIRDPRDHRELLTDILGVTVESGVQDVDSAPGAPETSLNLLSRRKREKAWDDIQDPVNRLSEEALLYPMEPLPDPSSADFPQYEPKMPPMPTLHRTETTLQKLLRHAASRLPEGADIPEPQLRLDEEPLLPDLPDPDFSNE